MHEANVANPTGNSTIVNSFKSWLKKLAKGLKSWQSETVPFEGFEGNTQGEKGGEGGGGGGGGRVCMSKAQGGKIKGERVLKEAQSR